MLLITFKILNFLVPTYLSSLISLRLPSKSSRIFENKPQNGSEYSHRNLAIARFLVTAVRKNIGGLLSWLVSLSSSVPELTRHGCKGASMSIPRGGGGC